MTELIDKSTTRLGARSLVIGRFAFWLALGALIVCPQLRAAEDLQALAVRQELRSASLQLREAPDRDALAAFYGTAQKLPSGDLQTASYAVVAVGLVRLDDHAAAKRIHDALVRGYGGEFYRDLLDRNKLGDVCERCAGEGGILASCKACRGTGACGNNICKGGRVTVPTFGGTRTKTCSVCRGSQSCPDCSGSGEVRGRCPACRGARIVSSKEKERTLFIAYLDRVDSLLRTPQQPQRSKQGHKRIPEVASTDESDWQPPKRDIPASFDFGSEESLLRSTGADKLLRLDGVPEHLSTPLKETAMWLANQQRREANPWAISVTAAEAERLPMLEITVTDTFSKMPEGLQGRLFDGAHRFWKTCCVRNKIDVSRAPLRIVSPDGKVLHERH